MTPTPEQIEKMAEEYADRIRNTLETADARKRSYKAGAQAMQSLMDAQAAEIEKLKAENSKLKENIQWLELDIKDMRELYLSNDSKLTLERAASAELLKYASHGYDCRYLGPNFECSCGFNAVAAAHHARQKERG